MTSLTDHEAMFTVLGPAVDALPDRIVVNLGSDTLRRARDAARWAATHGARYLTGNVQASPAQIGRPGSTTFYSGSREAFFAHRRTLEVLTATDFRGEDPGLAAVYYQLGMDLFWTDLLGWLHTVALAEAHGIPAGEHPGDVDRLAMGSASVEHVIRTARDAGVGPALPEAVWKTFQRGMAAGRSEDSVTCLIDVFTSRN